jgi:hypothetical protein
MPRVDLDSTCLEWADWAPNQGGILMVRYRDSGREYGYGPCPESLFRELLEAPSHGVFLNARIKPRLKAWPLS